MKNDLERKILIELLNEFEMFNAFLCKETLDSQIPNIISLYAKLCRQLEDDYSNPDVEFSSRTIGSHLKNAFFIRLFEEKMMANLPVSDCLIFKTFQSMKKATQLEESVDFRELIEKHRAIVPDSKNNLLIFQNIIHILHDSFMSALKEMMPK